MADTELAELLREIDALRADVASDATGIAARWQGWIERDAFGPSAQNLAHYLAFRSRDIRDLQRRVMRHGLSSLGRAEGRVLPTLDAVLRTLRAVAGEVPGDPIHEDVFFASEARIAARRDEVIGPLSPESPVGLLITLPSEAADDAGFAVRLAGLGVEAVRINCAHDDEAAWSRMIANVDRAAAETGRRMRVLMDLGGPKIRTGALRDGKDLKRVWTGADLAITLPGRIGEAPADLSAVECTLADAISQACVGHHIYIDDGKLGTCVKRREAWGVVASVVSAPLEKGYKLKPEKGINFPDTAVDVDPLTAEDLAALGFVAHHADIIGFSFVQRPDDVAALQAALERERPDDWQRLSLVLKIETLRAVRNLPDMMVRAAGRQPTAVMIARGDLAVEIGFARLAEMQEEILWLAEAAQLPVIWATQVLESYVKTGVPSRGEMTDAAMAARAECVMLNKGPHVFEAIGELDRLLGRMREHISKKTPRLRPLRSWTWGDGA